MKQVIFAGDPEWGSTSETSYGVLAVGSSWNTDESLRKQVVSTSGKFTNLRIKLGGAPGAGKSWAFTLMVNGAPSALTLEIADAATSGADTIHEVDVVAGDTVSLRSVPTDSPAGEPTTYTIVFEGSIAKESLILGTSQIEQLHTTGIRYLQPSAGYAAVSTSENSTRQVCPTSGKIKNLYVELSDPPVAGTPPDAFKYHFTLRINGADSDLITTISGNDVTGNSGDLEAAVVAGDILTLEVTPEYGPMYSTACWGMTFVADVNGESIILSGAPSALDDTDTKYAPLQCDREKMWQTLEWMTYNLGQSCTLKKLYMLLSAAPGADKSYTFTLRKGNAMADGNLAVVIANAATTGNDTAHTDVISNDNYVDLKCVPTNTPDVVSAYWGVVGYIAPPPAVIGPFPTHFRV